MLYAHLLACFPGWTYEYIDDHMTISRVLEINAYQKDSPPIHVMMAGYLGIGKTAKAETSGGQTLFDVAPQTPN